MELVGYYKRFFKGFTSISFLFTKLTHKTFKFQWSKACEESFQEFKTRLTIALVLTLPKGTESFVVYCHASTIKLGCLLMYICKVIAMPPCILRFTRETTQLMISTLQ
ncbi:hypothetical protein MTR67_001516 [Solanum verrucosum]|uniref:Reverse transcriptase/retrotransposon-derived protein RNase H-like domain-containing protein n=1 Tax=Solanum verrucosum TaxID=315347 RepID=A0AAF0PNV4_SOLVR|nr:hypothetical protein MTR67_001516 [Solanum verrucosum]